MRCEVVAVALMNPRLGILLLISDPVAIVAIVLTLSLAACCLLPLPFTSFAFEFAFCALFIISLANTSVLAAGCDLCSLFSPSLNVGLMS